MVTRRRVVAGLAVALVAAGLVLLSSHALAFDPGQIRAAPAGPPGASLGAAQAAPLPPVSDLAAADVLDKAEYRAAADFARRAAPYVHLDSAGVPRLDEGVTAAQLGVSEEFLRDFASALSFAGQAITEGSIVVHQDLTVETAGAAPPQDGVVAGARLGGEGSLDWQSWNYNTGAMFYNSYQDYWYYFYDRYYVLCASMAAQLGYPWMSNNLVYYYAYNGWAFNNYCGSGSGMYWFMPYSGSGCRYYNPCYCCGVSYRPIYIWVVTYQYYPSCRCQQPVWGWQGFWARY